MSVSEFPKIRHHLMIYPPQTEYPLRDSLYVPEMGWQEEGLQAKV